ncbi:MAG: hypothetical protein ACD_29C00269G0005 [uncultured bacterium]|nr:MAG: hypothetical protein ACD_29C00269G0005 [uncultured bacterium]
MSYLFRTTKFSRYVSFQLENGLTLLELLIAIAISSILLFSSVVSYRWILEKNQLILYANTLISAMHYARTLAIESKIPVILAPKDQNWQNGLIITDFNQKKLFRVYSPMKKPFQLIWHGSLNANEYIQWQPDGFTFGQMGSFLICNTQDSRQSVKIIILRTGRIRSDIENNIGCAS